MKTKFKKTLYSLSFFLLSICLFTVPTFASGLNWNGHFQTETRVNLDNSALTWQETNLTLQPEVVTNNTRFYGELCYRRSGLLSQNNSLLASTNSNPIELNEIYLDLYAYPWRRMDLRIGKQLIPWGTGYLLNPTSNLNPEDLRDVFDFGRYLGSNALKATTYLGEVTITGVFIPVFTPAALPHQQFQALFAPEMPSLPFTVNEQKIESILPAENLQESAAWGVKLEKHLLGCDFSVSYVDGRYSLPVPKITLTPVGEKVDLLCELIHPRRKIIGFDLAGAYGGLGFWSELAYFFPEEVKVTSDLTAIIGQHMEIVTLKDTPYAKYLIGMDYSADHLYFNGQYLHGFPQEQGKDKLGDYFLGRLEFTLNDGKIKIPFNACLEVRDFNKFQESFAYLFSPEVCFYPEMNTEITLSLRLIDGKSGTNLGKMKDWDEIGLKIKYSF